MFILFDTFYKGLISLMGGKWTIYRKMGEETIEEVINYLKGIYIIISFYAIPVTSIIYI